MRERERERDMGHGIEVGLISTNLQTWRIEVGHQNLTWDRGKSASDLSGVSGSSWI